MGDLLFTDAIKIPLEYFADNHGPFSVDFDFFIYDSIAIRCGGWKKCSAFHPALIAPSHIARDRLALFLGEGSVDGGDELAAYIDSIDPFTLESDIDTQLLQFTDILETVLGVAGKARDRFDKNLVDQAPKFR